MQRFIKKFSTLSPKPQLSSSIWRTQVKQTQLVSQISSILLQRNDPIPLLRTLNLSSKLTQSLFLQILHKTQHNPKISLIFFNWAKNHLGFRPDIKSSFHVAQTGLRLGSAKPIFEDLVQLHPASVIVAFAVKFFNGNDDSLSEILNLVLECYAEKKSYCFDCLEVFRKTRELKCSVPVRVCNCVLESLLDANEVRLAWCLYSAMIRDGVLADSSTFSVIARICSKDDKLERTVKLLDSGVYSYVIYENAIDHFSRIGDFKAAFDRMSEMYDRKIVPGFVVCSSILEMACKLDDTESIDKIINIMMERKLLPDIDTAIRKLCYSGKTYAAMFLFENVETSLKDSTFTGLKESTCVRLKESTFASMLTSLSKQGRTEDAIYMYHLICRRGISVDETCYATFANALCKVDQSEEEYELLHNVIKRGCRPSAVELSKLITSLCSKRKWNKVEELSNLILEMGFQPDLSCCNSLIEHYCSIRQIGKAVELHYELMKGKGVLDLTTYNVMLEGIFRFGNVEDAVLVFGYMREMNSVDGKSFVIMIRGLCRVKELRKAMKIHDDMLKMGMKPDKATYKRLISGFD